MLAELGVATVCARRSVRAFVLGTRRALRCIGLGPLRTPRVTLCCSGPLGARRSFGVLL